MYFSFDLTPLIIAFLGVSFIASLIISLIYCPFVRRVASRRRQCELTVDSSRNEEQSWPAASIIVYSQGESERLESFLPSVLSQDYPGQYEVIIVNEGDSADIRNLISALQLAHRNLYLTFTPDGARNLSRKKLALTLGIKAARFDTVVLTTVDAIISSNQWLTKMMRHFRNSETGIVLGYAGPSNAPELPRLSRSVAYAFATESVAWLSAAIGRRPFRGTELNLAYRRELFFANKGFSRSLNLHFGDDDIFISEIATRQNTVVELSPESMVRYDSYDNARTIRDAAVRHIFTERFIKHKPISRLAVGEVALWVGLVASLLAILFDCNNIVTFIVGALLPLISLVDVAISWRKTTSALSLRRLTLTSPCFTLICPFRRLALLLRAEITKQKKYTWD